MGGPLGKYDPYEHAHSLGIEVVERTVRTDNGLWVPDLRAIFLRPRMRTILRRSVLAHEIAHAELGHRSSPPKFELAADRRAARRLIDPDHLLDLQRWSPDPGVWCLELGVTPQLLQAFVHDPATLTASTNRHQQGLLEAS